MTKPINSVEKEKTKKNEVKGNVGQEEFFFVFFFQGGSSSSGASDELMTYGLKLL